jgi:hypothetical protein
MALHPDFVDLLVDAGVSFYRSRCAGAALFWYVD